MEWITGNIVLNIQGQPIEMQMTVPAKPVKPHRMLPVFQQMANAFVGISSESVEREGNAIACIKSSDSIRRIDKQNSKVVNREKIVLIQTPQTFEINQLRKAYQQHYKPKFTDDASVVEKAGFKINLIEGERNNLKITYPEDLKLASLLVKL